MKCVSTFLILGISLFVFSCKNLTLNNTHSKTENVEILKDSIRKDSVKNEFCFEVINNSEDSLLLEKEEMALIIALFETNGLKTDNLQFNKYEKDKFGYRVEAYIYVNGLKLLRESGIFYLIMMVSLKNSTIIQFLLFN